MNVIINKSYQHCLHGNGCHHIYNDISSIIVTTNQPLLLLILAEKVPVVPSRKRPSSSLPPYVIVVVILVPLVALVIIGAVLLWKQRKQPWFVRIFKRGDDTHNILQEDSPMEITSQGMSEIQTKNDIGQSKPEQQKNKGVVVKVVSEMQMTKEEFKECQSRQPEAQDTSKT